MDDLQRAIDERDRRIAETTDFVWDHWRRTVLGDDTPSDGKAGEGRTRAFRALVRLGYDVDERATG